MGKPSFADAGEGPADVGFDRAEGAVEDAGDLLVGVTLEEGQFERFALVLGESAQSAVGGRLGGGVFAPPVGRFEGDDAFVGGVFGEGLSLGLLASAGAEAVEALAADDEEEPGIDGGAGRIVALGCFPDAEEGILHGVFRFGVVSENVGGESEKARAVGVVKGFQGVGVSVGNAAHECHPKPLFGRGVGEGGASRPEPRGVGGASRKNGRE